MTSDEIAKSIEEVDREWGHPLRTPTNMQIDFPALRATLEVAYQLAILNEQIGGVLNSRIPQMAVRVESGEWPLQVQIQERTR